MTSTLSMFVASPSSHHSLVFVGPPQNAALSLKDKETSVYQAPKDRLHLSYPTDVCHCFPTKSLIQFKRRVLFHTASFPCPYLKPIHCYSIYYYVPDMMHSESHDQGVSVSRFRRQREYFADLLSRRWDCDQPRHTMMSLH